MPYQAETVLTQVACLLKLQQPTFKAETQKVLLRIFPFLGIGQVLKMLPQHLLQGWLILEVDSAALHLKPMPIIALSEQFAG